MKQAGFEPRLNSLIGFFFKKSCQPNLSRQFEIWAEIYPGWVSEPVPKCLRNDGKGTASEHTQSVFAFLQH